MIAFINTFLSYFILVAASVVVIIVAIICGKKWRVVKDSKEVNEGAKEE